MALFFLPFSYAITISQSSSQIISNTLLIDISEEGVFKMDSLPEFHVHVFNSTGLLLNGSSVSCKIHISNSTGYHVLIADMGSANDGFNITLNKNITGILGQYHFDIWCNATQIGGFASSDFIINKRGIVSKNINLIGLIIMFGIIIMFLLIISTYINIEALKYLLIAVSSFIMILMLNVGMTYTDEGYSTINSILSTSYLLVLYSLEFTLGIGIFFIIFHYATIWLPRKIRMKK